MEHLSEKCISWASLLEDQAREQAIRASKLPFVFPHLALMPDAHWGMGATVGSVIPTEAAIIPAAVGVDIGCGMMALRTDVEIELLKQSGLAQDLKLLHDGITKRIPLSAGGYNTEIYGPETRRRLDRLDVAAASRDFDPKQYAGNWELQLGSLGSGNHFIEVCTDEEGFVWLFLHSGSRGVGNKIAQKHIKVAKDLCARWHIPLEDPDLSYLVEGTPEFWAYIKQMQWAQEFAFLNREEMMHRVEDAFREWLGTDFEITNAVNCHHNYTQREKHFGRSVWLSRKGAIDASEGTWGLIPGSMGAASYVVQGKGNRVSLNSSPHGAGRMFSRKKARERFTMADLTERMQGVAWGNSDAFLDEHPEAYKDIDVVMQDAADLVEVRHTLRQIVNVKGA